MPLKLSREMTTHLFKYVKKVDIKFNPFDSRTKSARELLRQVQADRFKKANPKLKINAKVLGTVAPPSVSIEFVDGETRNYCSKDYIAKEMLDDLYLVANNLDIQYELEGKNIDG
ncbi:hypothetical protein CTEN210_06559 [Chaetoceros tenuissimus]|uniref:Large ribosomal subunit protein mL53 n=1 Tax=Chaetoceros tenuissimus TaxID=426638 RepID=A0AAD3CQL7_9STRA|nr:hypothetical protein CTEN210_06559 [Chaetoceros tenuissimus]